MGYKMRKLSNTEMFTFCEQMGMMIGAGIYPMEAVSSMIESTTDKEGEEILQMIYDKCTDGSSFHEALELTGVFPAYALNMIKIGEKTGNLEEVMKSLSLHYSREENITQSVKNAVRYPIILSVMMLVVIVILIVVVLPQFEKVFARLGTGIGGFAGVLLKIGNFLGRYSIVGVVVVAVCLALIAIMAFTEKGREMRRKFLADFFATKKVYECIATGRFASGMALSLSAGLNIENSLEEIKELVDHVEVNVRIDSCRKKVEDGKPFANALIKSGIFPGIYSGILLAGNKTGNMEGTLQMIADRYEEEVDMRINDIIGVLEPTIIIILSVLVGIILLSVMLPLLGILGGMI